MRNPRNGSPFDKHWADDYDNISGCVFYMAYDRGDTAKTIAEFVEKPWHFDDIYEEYQAKRNFDRPPGAK